MEVKCHTAQNARKIKEIMTVEIKTCENLTIMTTSIADDCDFCESSFNFKSIEMKNLEYSIMKNSHDKNLWNSAENNGCE